MMKKYSLLTLIFFATLTSFAQIQMTNQKSFQSRNSDYMNVVTRAGSPAAVASIDTIWSDDFSDTTLWNYVGGLDEWNVSDSLTSSLIGQGFDPVLNSNSGGNFAIIDSDGSGSTGVQNAFLEYNQTINCSGYSAVQLMFQTYLRQYQETREVFVSSDNGATWDSVQVLTQFGSSSTSPNPYTEIVDISPYAGGKSAVLIKFKYSGAFDWFWAIDDVVITTIPNNDLELTQEYYNGTSDNTYSNYYTMVPVKQADSAMLYFGAEVENKGNSDQTNAFLNVQIDFNGDSIYSENSDTVTIDSGQMHLFDFTNYFLPDSGIGTYDMFFEVNSDSTDATPEDNIVQHQMEVSSYQYRRDNDMVTNDNWFDGNSWEMLVKYEIYQEDTVVALSAYFPYNYITNRGLEEGDSISYYVYRSTDLVNPISEYTNYKIQQADVNSWVSLPMPFENLSKGIYYVGFKIQTNHGSIGTNANINTKTAPLTVLVRTNSSANTDPWQFTTSFTPFVRMFTKTNDGCGNVNINMSFDVVDTLELGSVEPTITGTGAEPYNYSWTGPNNFSATTKNIYDLENQGLYVLTVTDVFGCEGVDTATVAGSVLVKEIENRIKWLIAPNPTNGNFIISGHVQEPGKYVVLVYNNLGMRVMQTSFDANNDFSKTVNLTNYNSGVYILQIISPKGIKESKIVLKE
ncbi:MAG: T9SS type A sorting domain-containing protein [Salibacteraceae bacterium]